MLLGILLLFLSFVSTPSLFVNRFEGLKNFYSEVSSYRAMIGVGYLIYGLFNLFGVLVAHFIPLHFVASLTMVLLGFILGFQWIMANWFKSNYELRVRLNEWHAHILPYEGYLGIGALVLAILFIVQWLI